jgi:hypothetical protein
LSESDWKKKLKKIDEKFEPESIYVVVTENLSGDIVTILGLVSETIKKSKFFLVDTRKELIYSFKLKNGIEVEEILVKGNRIFKKKSEISLERYLR